MGIDAPTDRILTQNIAMVLVECKKYRIVLLTGKPNKNRIKYMNEVNVFLCFDIVFNNTLIVIYYYIKYNI